MSSLNDLNFATSPNLSDRAVPAVELSQGERTRLLEQGRAMLCEQVCAMMHDAFAAMNGALSELAERSADDASAAHARAAASVVLGNLSAMRERFDAGFVTLFSHRLAGHLGALPRSAAGKHELALVDDAFMRNKLLVERLVQRTRVRLDSDEVLGMRARLGVLAGRDWFDEASFPGSPGAVFEALQLAIDGVACDAAAKVALLEIVEPYVTTNLNAVYMRVNAQWRAAGVLPAIRPRVALTPDGGRVAPDMEGDAATERSSSVDRSPARSVVPDVETFVLPPSGPERETILAALARDVAAGGLAARQSAIKVLTEPLNFGLADLQMPEEELIAALDSIQANQPDGEPSKGELAALTGRARDSGSPLDQLTVEIVSLIFDFLYDDPRIPEPVKNQLGRLQVVAIKAALLDRSFFASRQHPMRQLIDRTSDIACDPEIDAQEGSPFIAGVRRIVDSVLHDFDRDLAAFQVAVEQIEALEVVEVARHAGGVRALAEAGERSERQASLHAEAIQLLDARMDDMTPEFARVFLTDVWAALMVAVRLDDLESVEWESRLRIAEQLLWSVGPRKGREVRQLAAMLPAMIGGLSLASREGGMSAESYDELMLDLMRWHSRVIASAKRADALSLPGINPRRGEKTKASPIAVDATGQVRFSGAVVAPVAVEAELSSDVDRIAMLTRGQRFELRRRNQSPIVCKLAWISPARKLFALSRFPDYAQSLDRASLLALLEGGELTALAIEPVLDRAIGAVATE